MSAVETPVCIVLAWTTADVQYVGKGAAYEIVYSASDRLLHPWDWQDVMVASACMWCNEGAPEEVKKARAHAAAVPGAMVFVYEVGEPDPLGRAKREILEKKERS